MLYIPPLIHTHYRLQSSEWYKYGCLVFFSTNWDSDWGKINLLAWNPRFTRTLSSGWGWFCTVLAKQCPLVNIKMTWEMLHTSRQFIWNSYVQSRNNWWYAHTHNTYTRTHRHDSLWLRSPRMGLSYAAASWPPSPFTWQTQVQSDRLHFSD